EYEARFEHGELLNADSVHIDSSKVYRTLSGRKVYGGGGIMPDLFVPTDTAQGSAYLSELFFSGTLNEFAFDVVDRTRTQFLSYGGYQAFSTSYHVSEQMLTSLKAAAKAHGIVVKDGDAARSHDQIVLRLKASIARGIWGDAGFYHIILQDDPVFKAATSRLAVSPVSELLAHP
ncbi:MAG TPA: hypothetical protein PK760_11930, partial [Flavobacteriales bacterium]|nr:hypothetical protein [Flavobacteriales bacterium]